MRSRLNKILIIITIFSISSVYSYCQDKITPAELGLKIYRGQIDKRIMTASQKDTVIISPFNYEDNFLDIAVYYPSNKEIVIYRNLGNGYLSKWRTFPQRQDVRKIEASIPENSKYFQYAFDDIKISYKDGPEKILKNTRINYDGNSDRPRVPLRDFLDDPRVFVYDVTFIEVWRSMRNGTPARDIAKGDLDNDGRNEVVFTFWPVVCDTCNPQPYPTRMVVFECYGDNQYRIDWDTTFENGGYNYQYAVTDFDRNGEKEFFGVARGWNNQLTDGLFEYKPPGRYKFYFASNFTFHFPVHKVIVLDTVRYASSRKAGFWFLGYPGSIQLCVFSSKGGAGYGFLTFFGQPVQSSGAYDMVVGDIDNDSKEEIVVGDTQFGTNYITYLDSTGINSNRGYETKEITPNAPVSAGYLMLKDHDNNIVKEILTCGIGSGTGSIGVLKHTGTPGQNQFTTMWWDSSGIFAGPNWGIDSGSIDGRYSILYSNIRSSGPLAWENLITFTRSGTYSFYKSSFREIDSTAFVGARFFDMDKDGKMNIITGAGVEGPQWKDYLVDYEQTGVIGITPISNEIPENFNLYQNYPNPFNPVTNIKYQISKGSSVKLILYDILGKEMEILVNQKQNPGTYKVEFNGTNFSSGVYFYSLIIDGQRIDTKRMVLIK